MGCTADVLAAALDDLRGVPAGSALRRARFREAQRGRCAVRHGERALRLRLGERLADAPPQDERRALAPAGHARSVLVLRGVLCRALRRAASCAGPACNAAGRKRAAVLGARRPIGAVVMRKASRVVRYAGLIAIVGMLVCATAGLNAS